MGGWQSNKNKNVLKSESWKAPGSDIKQIYHISKKLIGKGAFAKVFKGRSLANPKFKVAIKSYKYSFTSKIKSIQDEIKVLCKLDHPNIVKYYGAVEDVKNPMDWRFNHLYVITEYVKGTTLTNMLAKNKYGLPEVEVAFIMNQLVSAINHCHNNSIVHRDIKPDNIMIDENMHVTLIDFGFSTVFSNQKHLKSITGSPLFMAPEIVGQKYDSKIDIWSLGILMYVMLSGRLPFSGNSPNEVLKQSLECDLALEEIFGNKVSPEAVDLLQKMITLNSSNRLSSTKVLKHEWFDMIKDDLTDDSSEQTENIILDKLSNFRCISRLKHFILISLVKMTKDKAINQLYQDFKKIDENEDCMISEAELKNAYDKLNYDMSSIKLKEIIKNLDFYENKHINLTEFLVAVMEESVYKQPNLIKSLFNQFDRNSDGQITKEDVLREFQLMDVHLSKTELKQIFHIHDVEKSGYISYHNFFKSIMN